MCWLDLGASLNIITPILDQRHEERAPTEADAGNARSYCGVGIDTGNR
jgi:hypothetical protein